MVRYVPFPGSGSSGCWHAGYLTQVQWHEAGAWIWVALLVNAIVTGRYQLLATAGGSAEGQPAIIR